jgi:DNA-binding transcriptional ArsR family regulator
VSLRSEIAQVLADRGIHQRWAIDPDALVDELVAIAQRHAKALAHPLRGQILTLLEDGGRRSPNQLARELGNGAPLGTVSYHVRYLHRQDLIRLVDTQPRRGAIEHFYEAR